MCCWVAIAWSDAILCAVVVGDVGCFKELAIQHLET
jgi:hypothetical protein